MFLLATFVSQGKFTKGSVGGRSSLPDAEGFIATWISLRYLAYVEGVRMST